MSKRRFPLYAARAFRSGALSLACALSAVVSACERTPETSARAHEPEAPSAPSSTAHAQAATTAPSTSAKPMTADAAEPAVLRFPARARVVAIGDVHGDYDALKRTLVLAGAIDSELSWVGKDLTVVQTGDQLDRGDREREIIELLERLEGEAKAHDSDLFVLNGNHELMNAMADFRYVTARGFAEFESLAPGSADKAAGRHAAFAPGGPYARKLARRATVLMVGDTLFAHGGVLPAHVDYGLARINADVSHFLLGKERRLPAAVANDDGVVWTRLYGEPEPSEAACETLGRTLAAAGAKRMVVGHTVQPHGISAACGSRVYRIDVGLASYYGHAPAQALELRGSQATILDASKPKPGPKPARGAAAPAEARPN